MMNETSEMMVGATLRWEQALQPGDEVLVRWTNSFNYYSAIAMIVRVNEQSVRVQIIGATTNASGEETAGKYLIGRTLSFPRFLAAKASQSNGVFPIPEVK